MDNVLDSLTRERRTNARVLADVIRMAVGDLLRDGHDPDLIADAIEGVARELNQLAEARRIASKLTALESRFEHA